MPEKLARNHLPPRDRVSEQESHRATLDFADDGVVGEQEGNERQQEDRQTRQLTTVAARALALTTPAGTLPRKASVKARAASSIVVAIIHRLRNPS